MNTETHILNRYVKYPRTFHLHYSPGISNDDRCLKDDKCFQDKAVVVSIKVDGECFSGYSDYVHARSLSDKRDVSRNFLKSFWSKIGYNLPARWRICGENLYVHHTIYYSSLPSYILGYSVWNDKNECLPWDESLEWFNLLNIIPVPVFYRGIYDKDNILQAFPSSCYGAETEGFVVRLVDGFRYRDFRKSVAKYVTSKFKQDMKQSDVHWSTRPVVKNQISQEKLHVSR